MSERATGATGWREVVAVLTRPQPVTAPMVVLAAIIPSYLVVGEWVSSWTHHRPEIALDRVAGPQPEWSLVYLSLFLAALLPVFVLHQQDLIRRTLLAFIAAWVLSLACFLAYPTVGPRPAHFSGDGFAGWLLMEIYSADAKYNCFPSLHVAQSFLAAYAAFLVHRGVGVAAWVWAFLVGVSTVYTKQHYVLDAVAGMILATVLYAIFMRGYPRVSTPLRERELAPVLACLAVAVYGLMVGILWAVYVIGDGKVY